MAKGKKSLDEASDVTVTTEVIVDSIINPKPKTSILHKLLLLVIYIKYIKGYAVAGIGGISAFFFITLSRLLPDRIHDAYLDYLLY